MFRIASSSAALVLGSFFVAAASAREQWPTPSGADLERIQAVDRYEEELVRRLQPELAAWAAKGKPYVPAAAQPNDLPQSKVPAFPGAEGAGSRSFGGRGGRVYVVTTLADSGPGSLREACEAAGPRVVVFNVAGIIHLEKPVFIEAPYITIAGQSAPGDGICIADEGLVNNAHDVVIRYVRFRRGNRDIFNRHGNLYGNPVGNIVIDHCSASWGNDQNIDTYRHMYQPPGGGPALKLPSVNVTIQWTISSEALNTYNHAFGGNWGGNNTSFHHNLFASNTGRNPSVAMSYDFNFVNNVLFNWRHRSVDGGDQHSRYNVINNYYKPGPATPESAVRHRILMPAQSWKKKNPVSRWGKAYVAGNVVEGYPAVTADNWDGGVQLNQAPNPDANGRIPNGVMTDEAEIKTAITAVCVDEPFPMAPLKIESATDAYAAVLANAGATLPVRDAVDARVLEAVKTGAVWSPGKEIRMTPMEGLAKNNIGTAGNGIITDIAQVGGYPEYRGEPDPDVGADGIPAWWKRKYGLDTNDPELANKDLKNDGYTVLDKYLDGLDPTKAIDWSKPESNVNTLTAAAFRRS
ncbi:polysaccharide lyase [Opitutaceae bacterium EW11]|nr:polysaccharide lyase [Opitutaceae bacterium EW11]